VESQDRSAAETQAIAPPLERQPVQRPQRALTRAGERSDPRKPAELVRLGVSPQRLSSADRDGEHPLKTLPVLTADAQRLELSLSPTTADSTIACEQVCLGLLGADRGTRKREGRQKRMRPSASSTSQTKNPDLLGVVVLRVGSVARETSMLAASRTDHLSNDLLPGGIQFTKAIVSAANVE
jgi:hypothetical protein